MAHPAMRSAAAARFSCAGGSSRWSQTPADLGRSVRIELHAEPRAELLRGDWHVTLNEAADRARPIASSAGRIGNQHGRRGETCRRICLVVSRFGLSASPDTRLARLRGSVDVLLAAEVVSGQAPDHAGDRTLGGPMPIHLACGASRPGCCASLPMARPGPWRCRWTPIRPTWSGMP